MKSIFTSTLALTLLCVSALVFAQNQSTIIGKVRDAETGSPLPFVNVVVAGTRFGDATDEAGDFKIKLPAGDYTVQISRIGYRTTTREVRLAAAADSEIEIMLARQPLVVEEVVVTASAEHSCPCGCLDEREIHRLCSRRDIGEMFRQIPGAAAVKRGGTALDPVFRGSQGDQLNVTIDGGMHVNGACPNRMDPPTFHVEAEDLEKVEIFKGPYAVRLGPASAGVVNLVMAKPEQFSQFAVHGKLESSYESIYAGKKGRLSLWGGNKGYDFNLTAGAENYDDYKDGRGLQVPSEFRTTHYAAKFGLNPAASHRLQISHRQSFARDLKYPALPMDADKDDTQMYAVDYLGGGFHPWLESMAAKAYFSRVDHVMSNTHKPTYSTVHSVTDVNTKTSGGRLEGTLRVSRDGRLSLGADYSDLEKDGMRTRDMVAGTMAGKHFDDIVWPNAEMKNFGIFAELRKPLTGRLFSTVGTRMDFGYSQARHPEPAFVQLAGSDLNRRQTVWSGNAHLRYRFSERMEFGLSAGRGVRLPNITERYIYLLPVGLDRYDYLGNPDLQPEENWQGEMTMKGTYGLVSFEAAAFYSHLRNYISARLESGVKPRSPGVLGVKRYDNLEHATKIGGEIQATIRVTSALSLQGTMFYTRGENEDTGQPLPEIPPLEGQLRIRYEAFNGRGWVQLQSRWVAEQNRISQDFGELATPGFTVLNFRAGMQFGKFVEVAASVENLLNEAYYEHLTRKRQTDRTPIYEPGRNFGLAVNLGW